jgi:nucleoside-diphosphate-sugar epimerase
VVAALTSDRAVGRILNAGTGHDVSVNELAALVEPDAERIVHVPHIHPQSEIAVLRCDPRLAAELLGWQPSVALSDGLARVRSWMGEQLGAGIPVP